MNILALQKEKIEKNCFGYEIYLVFICCPLWRCKKLQIWIESAEFNSKSYEVISICHSEFVKCLLNRSATSDWKLDLYTTICSRFINWLLADEIIIFYFVIGQKILFCPIIGQKILLSYHWLEKMNVKIPISLSFILCIDLCSCKIVFSVFQYFFFNIRKLLRTFLHRSANTLKKSFVFHLYG